MKQEFDIVVIGAGMVGLATVALLAQSSRRASLNIRLIDAGTRPAYDSQDDVALRVSAISRGSMQVLQKIGVWEYIIECRACPYSGMRVWDSRDVVEGPNTLQFDAADFAVAELGFIVENGLIQQALLQCIEKLDVTLCFETPIEGVSKKAGGQGFDICLQDGELINADLVVGADGAASLVRQSAGISVSIWSYPQSALVTHVRPERPHRATAWQRFLNEGPVAFLPLEDGRVSVVWSTTPERAEQARSASDAELAAMLGEASDHVLGELEVAGPRGAFPLRSQHAERYVLPGLALVGDAAHAVHPLAGQGVNLGFADAQALATAISDALLRGEYPGDLPTLRRYERERKGANRLMLHFVDALNRLFMVDSEVVAGLRSGGMRLFNSSGPVQHQAVRVALGV